MTKELTISERQLQALYRVVHSMNCIGGSISVTNDESSFELLLKSEMTELAETLRAVVEDPNRSSLAIDGRQR